MLDTKIEDKALQAQLLLMKMPPGRRRNLMRKMARKVQTKTRKRLRAQETVSGSDFAPRKNGKKQKMLRKLGRFMKTTANPSESKVYFNNAIVARIAYAQQHGLDEVVRARDFKRKPGTANATRQQAKALIKAGYKKPQDGRLRRVSQKWIMENMSIDQAGAILRTMRDKPAKEKWVIPGTPRPFLGASESDIKEILIGMEDDFLNSILL